MAEGLVPVGAAASPTGLSGGHGAEAPPRLVRAAHEFEAQMMKELLKPMTSSDPLTGEEEASSSASGGVLGEFAGEAMARGLSDRGGFGIANKIVGELSRSGNTVARSR
jgi:Rod binding domain-containing protein